MESKLGLSNKESFRILYSEIQSELIEFKKKNLNIRKLFNSFLKQNNLEFVHNLVAIALCSISLLISYNQPFFPNIANSIFILVISLLNLFIIIFIYFKKVFIIYSKVKSFLPKIEGCLFISESFIIFSN
jgi:hypothetical protein